MSELDVIKAVLPRLRTDLAATDPDEAARVGGPLYTQRSGPYSLEAEATRRRSDGQPPLSPVFLISPGPTPSAPNRFDSIAQFFLEGWGKWKDLDEAFARIAWLEDHEAGKSGRAARIRYGKVGGTRPKEPETTLADGGEEYHYTNTYRALYVDLARLSGPMLTGQARAP